MNPSREEALFALALDLPAEKRAALLDAKCEGDPDLRQRLVALLASHEEPESLAGPDKWQQFDDEPAPAKQAGSLVGRYKLLEKLGVGGCDAPTLSPMLRKLGDASSDAPPLPATPDKLLALVYEELRRMAARRMALNRKS